MSIEWTPEEQRQIEMSLEVRRRERAEIQRETAAAACARNEHIWKDGKCAGCGIEQPPEPKKKGFSPIE